MHGKKQDTEKSKTPTKAELIKILKKSCSEAERLKANYATPLYLKDAYDYYVKASDICSSLFFEHSLPKQERQKYEDKFFEIHEKMEEVDKKIRHYYSLSSQGRRDYVDSFYENLARKKRK
jgi:hypothetical protein